MPIHLRPSAPTARQALLCGDPARALTIAQRVLDKPRISNHHRGLWGYFGKTSSGLELTVQSTGIGGPSAAIVVGELAELGLEVAIRIGTCGALGESLPLGAGVVVGAAIAGDGTSVALGVEPGTDVKPDDELTRLVAGAMAATPLAVLSRDVPTGSAAPASYAEGDAAVTDLQTSAVLAATRARGIAAAAMLAVAVSGGRRLEDEPLEAALVRLSEIGVEALKVSASARG